MPTTELEDWALGPLLIEGKVLETVMGVNVKEDTDGLAELRDENVSFG